MKITFAERIYDLINNEENARACNDIPEEACRSTPKNYFLILFSNMLTKLGDTLSNPKTVLAWITNYVGAPVYLISFIVPIRESGSMLPQIVIASYIRKKPIRKWVYVLGSVLQFLSIAGIGLVTLFFEGTTAGWLMILLLICFSLSRGLCSVASKDVLGKTIPKRRRGRLKGYTVAVSGILVLGAGLFMIYKSQNEAGLRFYAYTLFFASAMWILAALIYSQIKEYAGATSGGKNGWKEAINRIGLVKSDAHFRHFIIARSLLLCSALTAPFYVVLAQEHMGKDAYILGLFIIANGLASILSAPVWGNMADRSSKNVMTLAASITSVLGLLMVVIIWLLPSINNSYWLYPVAYFILGVAHSGARLGRKTYVVDMASGNQRTDYVSVSNTVIGAILLITGGLSALASMVSVEGVILVLSLLGVAGAIVSYRLPNVE